MARGIYPLLDVVVERADQTFVNAALVDTDRRVGEGKPVAPSFLLACALWADVRDGWAQRITQHQHSHPALLDAIDDVFNARIGDVSGRGKLAADMRDIWMMQPRFDKRVGSAPFGLVDQPRFRAGFDFMRLRADAGEIDEALADWWQEFSTADDVLRQDLVDQVRQEQTRQRPRTVRSRTAPAAAGSAAQLPNEPMAQASAQTTSQTTDANRNGEPWPGTEDGPPSEAPKKRRRRRRSGAAKSQGEGQGGSGDDS
jgi:poly(A) polymerase